MLDQLSPVAPARVRAVLLPIGQIKRARFLSFVDRLQPENVVRLGDISPDGRPNRNMFSPLAFPSGTIVYDLITHYPPASHVSLSPFELYREPLVIIAIADGTELDHVSFKEHKRRSLNTGNSTPLPEQNLRELDQDLEDLRDRYPKALVHQLLVFDYVHRKSGVTLPEGLVAIPPPADSKTTTVKTVLCDISSMLLAEMTTLAKSLQALSTIDSPSIIQGRGYDSGGSWSIDDVMSRRNSIVAMPTPRTASPAPGVDRGQYRMSMPPTLRSASSYSHSPSRPTTPLNGGPQTELPTTFEQIVGPDPRQTPSQTPSLFASRFSGATPAAVRDTSRDRVSVQGFGPGSSSERSRTIGRGRIGIVVGSLYLNAGRWGDAIRDLVEAVTIAKNNLDHLWHAKALENILVSMIMLAWAGLDFQIPQVCYISAEKIPPGPGSLEPRSPTTSRLVSLQNLVALLPELLERIMSLYARAASNTGEALPQYPFSETVIRFSKLLAAVHLAGGTLNDEVLQFLVVGTPFAEKANLLTPRLTIRPTRTEIVRILFRAFPSPYQEQLSVIDRASLLGGIASVLGALGYNRKKAMVIRELVAVLTPGLVQARIAGAAEMGVHPAAGLASLSPINGNSNGAGALDLGGGDIENGVDEFLGLLSQSYGVVASKSIRADSIDDSDESVTIRIVHNATVRSFGGQSLKMDVLRSCINLSEALPDFHGVLRFSADLLRTAGSGVAPGPRSEDASPAMTREEQVKLVNNISRTLSSARNLGVKDIEAEYWDEFLVRGVDLEALPETRTPIPHTRNELPGVAEVSSLREKNPFIYNPFLKKPDTAAVNHLLVAEESAVFKITLQNPYEFDVEIESIRLESEGCKFESGTQRTLIGPYRTQILTLSGTPKTSGPMKITGCIVRVKGCRERRFPIFREPWSPQADVKIKSIGLNAILKERNRPLSVGSGPVSSIRTMIPPKPAVLPLNVIERQPVVVVKLSTLSQSAVMILEGERQRFSVTLQNVSQDTAVDLILFSFKDSTQAPLQTAMGNRELSPAELYEMELIYARKQAIHWIKKEDEKPYIAPGGTATFEMEILGKPGLTSAVVQVDYACLGLPEGDIPESFDAFHTRQVSLPITVTVNASIEMVRMDCLPLTGSIPSSLWDRLVANESEKKDFKPDDYCLMVLDLRNAWPSTLNVHLDIVNGGALDEELLPGNTSRIMFPIQRIFLEDPAKPIPTLDPARQRQFVVSTGQVSADAERSSREAFWYREEILKILHGTWSTKTGSFRKGDIELRGIRLSTRVIEAIKIDDIGIDFSLTGNDLNQTQHEVLTDSFSELRVRITNRTTEPVHPFLRVQPSIRNQPHNISLDLSKKLIFNGTLQQSLPQIAGHVSIEVTFGMTTLCRGEFEISASVEEAKLQDSDDMDENGKLRPRANTRMMLDALLGTRERRIWHSREPCLLVVRDGDDESDDEE